MVIVRLFGFVFGTPSLFIIAILLVTVVNKWSPFKIAQAKWVELSTTKFILFLIADNSVNY